MSKIFTTKEEDSTFFINCINDWLCQTVHKSLDIQTKCTRVVFNLKNIKKIDSAGAMALLTLKDRFKGEKKDVLFENVDEKTASLIELCDKYREKEIALPARFKLKEFLLNLDDAIYSYFIGFLRFLGFVGKGTSALFKTFLAPQKIRFKATLYHMEHNGFKALPIIAITSLLIGVVVAYQGAVQLEKFGANIFIVEMVGISVTRELAPLIVAIVVAGRSASAFTAQIGVMQITDEVDAMRTMGFGPWEFLVLPRVVALILVLPLLVFFGDVVAIFGGMIIAQTELNISMAEFISRFQESVELKHTIIGLVKAPVFGALIAFIGCYRGFEIRGTTESVGKYTTISIVNAVFWVIAFDALFSIFLTELGI